MKIFHISDTHGKHTDFTDSIPNDVDVLIHSGDFSDLGIQEETEFFLRWFKSLPAKHKILIAGNHDFTLDENHYEFAEFDMSGIHYLNNESIEIEGLKFYGNPLVLMPLGGSFTYYEEADGELIWRDIPDDTDVLITHGPAFGILDKEEKYSGTKRFGCRALLERLEGLYKLKAHCFGHIHQARGMETKNSVIYSNAATRINLFEINQ